VWHVYNRPPQTFGGTPEGVDLPLRNWHLLWAETVYFADKP
jgi:hypothetical protein